MCWSKGDSGSPFNRKIMDYEKKYKEALEKAKKFHTTDSNNSNLKAVLEIIFNELAESEDERIRKELKEAFEAYDIESKWNGIPIRSIFAWLEKQKEPLPIPDKFTGLKSLMLQYFDSAVHRNDDAEIESDTDLWGRKILGYVWKYSDEQKEQKPWKVGANAYFTPEQKPDTRDADDLQLLGFIYDLLNEIEWKDNWAMSKDECLRRLNNYHPQKPVSISCGHENDTEWSEEDKEKIVAISEIIEHCTTIPYSGGTLTLNKEYKKELLCFIRSLRPQPQGTYKQVIHTIFGMLKDKDFYEIQPSHRVSLLNDIRAKCKDAIECAPILDEPQWKPSEEQMAALEAATVRYQSTGLESLYEELKKL